LSFDQAWLFEETIVARSDHMLKVIAKAKQLAPRTIQVLITGETGTGKEVVARLLHRLSSRVSGPIIAVNCAALPEGVFESELFGHRRGAFTGADRDHAGLVERASGGTLFLDEISELTGHQQAKLLRVLQEGAIRRIGDTKERAVDVRVVTATNEDIETLLQSKRLREDFYYRIAAEHIELEPLRRRREDIIALFAYFLESEREGFRIEDGILELMERHHWPGNVRELENVTRVLAMLGGAERIIRIKDLSLKIRDFTAYERLNASRAGSYFMRENPLSRESCTGDPAGVCRLIASSLRRHDGNRSAAARELGVSRRTLYRRMAELGLLEE
jgi:two-component system response regulator AtoC